MSFRLRTARTDLRARQSAFRLRTAVAAMILLAAAGPASADPWLDDFEAFKAGLADNYANFEHLILARRTDLPSLAKSREAALRAAKTDQERRAVFDAIVRDDLRDPHVRIDWSPQKDSSSVPCPKEWSDQEVQSGLRWERIDGFKPLPGPNPFRAGTVPIGSGRRLGVIRIGQFSERAFPSICGPAAERLQLRPDEPCGSSCELKLEKEAGRAAAVALAETLHRLEAGGAERIAFDLIDTSGGSDWVEAAMRVAGGELVAPDVGMLKHPAWRSQLETLKTSLQTRVPTASPAERRELQARIVQVDDGLRRLSSACDLRAAWTVAPRTAAGRALPCTRLVSGVMVSTGLKPLKARKNTSELADVSLRYAPYPVGVTRMPLVVIVHDNTHSAAELFAAALRDNGRAIVVGATTSGAGCGQFTQQGAGFRLPNSGALVHVPDCTRQRADRSDERGGVEPDVAVPWGPSDSGYQWTAKVVRVIADLDRQSTKVRNPRQVSR